MSDNKNDELSSLSKVTSSKNKRVMSKAATIAIVFVVLMLFFTLYAVTHRHHQKKQADISTNNIPNTHTLQENLSALERMQQEALAHQQKPEAAVIPVLHEIDPEIVTRMNAPTTFINVDEPATNQGHKNPELAAIPMIAGNDANSTFLNTKNIIESVNAIALPHPDFTLSAGEFIPATLETAVNSDLPGMVRALTSRDVYALTGNRILIPKGSRLIGQYSSGHIGDVQTRLLVSWTRVQLPNGVVVTLNSPSADSLGRGGQGADSIDSHFVEKFSSGFLFSVLGATTATLGVNQAEDFNSATAYRMGVANSFQESARDSLTQTRRIQPTLHLDQGANINGFVARDLSFFNVVRKS